MLEKRLLSDEFDHILTANVHPATWVNPVPSGPYDLVVIGAGTAGLVTAAVAAALGAKVALIERELMGGDCLNVGCVPSKAVIRAARAWVDVRRAETFGMPVPAGVPGDFGAAMRRMRRLRAELSPVDSAQRFKGLGVDVFLGQGAFAGPTTITVGATTLAFKRAAVCTGARATVPPIPGIRDAGYLTNETVFGLTELPSRLAVLGAGPIGCELAQTFARFGSRVTLFEQKPRILPRDDRDAADIVQRHLRRDGVTILLEATVTAVARRGTEKVLQYSVDGRSETLAVDEILIGVGRAPNVEDLGLDRAGVAYDVQRGVVVNDRLRTTNSKIYAAGDVCSGFRFTHAADAMAQIVIQNALFPHPLGLGTGNVSSLVIPWCTYTQPEVAHVGLSADEAREKGVAVDTFSVNLEEVDRAILDGEADGFGRIHVKRGTDTIVGATIVAAHAGELITEVTLAMRAGLGLRSIAGTIHPYPTQAEVVRKVANAWRKTTLTDRKKRLLAAWFRWMR